MVTELEAFYISKEEPTQCCLFAMRKFILEYDDEMTESWTHRMPMFRYRGKLFCYLWVGKKTYRPYLGIYKGIDIEHPDLDLGTRNKMKILNINPDEVLPLDKLNEIFGMAMQLYVKIS